VFGSKKSKKKYTYNSKRRKCSVFRVKKKYSRLIICNYKEEEICIIFHWKFARASRENFPYVGISDVLPYEGILQSNFVGRKIVKIPSFVFLQTVAEIEIMIENGITLTWIHHLVPWTDDWIDIITVTRERERTTGNLISCVVCV
jgi:hypothetical protein